MKNSKPKAKRSHGLSRLERLLQASISHEIRIKSLRRELLELSARIARVEAPPGIYGTLSSPTMEELRNADWIGR